MLQEYDHRHAGKVFIIKEKWSVYFKRSLISLSRLPSKKATNPHHMTDNLHRNVLATYKRDAPFLTHGSGTSTTTAPRGRHPLSKPIGHHKPSSSSLLRPGSSSTRPRSSSPTKQQQQQQIKGKTPASPQLKATSADTSSNIASNNNAMSDFGSYRIDWDIRDMIISPNGSRSGSMALRTTSSGGGGGQRIGSASSATTTASSSKARSELGDSEIDHLDGLGSPSSFSDDAAGGLGTGGGGGGEGSSSNLFLDGEEDEYLSEELEENELKRLRKEGIKQMKRLAAQQQQQTFLYSTGGEYHDHHQGMRGIGGGGGGSVDDEDSTTNTTTPSSDGIPVSPYQHHQYYQSQQQHQGGGSSGSSTPKIKPSSSFGVGGSNFVLDTYAGTTGHQRPTSAAVAANSSGIGSSGVSGSVASGSDSGSRTSPVASPDISAAVSGAAVSPLTSPDLAPVATNTNAALLSSSSSSYSSSSSSASSSNNNPTVLRALLPPLPPISEKRFESSTATASSFGKTNQKMQASQAEHLPTRFSQSDILKVLLNSNVASVAPAAESYSSASSMTTTTPSIPPLVPRILHKSASVSSLASNEKTTTTTTMTTAVSCSESDTSSFAGLNSGYPNAATPTAKKKKKKSNNKKKKKSKK